MASDREYMRVYVLARYHRRRAAAIEQLGGACRRCGEKEGLTFDHVDPSTKLSTIGEMLAGASEERLQTELAKCQLLCDPCHIEKSRENGDFGGGHNRIVNPEHGTQVMFNRERCRCEPCLDWRRKYRKGAVDARGNPKNRSV